MVKVFSTACNTFVFVLHSIKFTEPKLKFRLLKLGRNNFVFLKLKSETFLRFTLANNLGMSSPNEDKFNRLSFSIIYDRINYTYS